MNYKQIKNIIYNSGDVFLPDNIKKNYHMILLVLIKKHFIFPDGLLFIL